MGIMSLLLKSIRARAICLLLDKVSCSAPFFFFLSFSSPTSSFPKKLNHNTLIPAEDIYLVESDVKKKKVTFFQTYQEKSYKHKSHLPVVKSTA